MVSDRCFVIAEAGVNHNGSEELAARLIEAAADSGADAVKFQTFSTDKLVAPGAQTAAYQREATGATDQLAMLKALELPAEAFARLKALADRRGIEFMSTPFDIDAASMLVKLGMRRIKVGSGEITNVPLLEDLAGFDLPLILSTGMADMDEVAQAVLAIKAAREKRRFSASLPERLTLLHCTSNYPAAPEDANLRAMAALAERFRLPVGYSDHSEGTALAVAAAALGATVLEKHFTLDRGLPGPDHRASLAVDEFRRMVTEIRAVEAALGDGVKAPRASELPVRDAARRSVTLLRGRRAGERIQREDLTLLRPGNGIAPTDLAKVAGKRAARDLDAGRTLAWEDLTE
jgi:N,N'-diacetyllegionaminate synthase